MKKALIGKKVGMTQIFDENGSVIPVTVIEVLYQFCNKYPNGIGQSFVALWPISLYFFKLNDGAQSEGQIDKEKSYSL